MGVFSGPEIVNDGLVFHFDLQNSVKSWKGKPTSNLVPDPTFTTQEWNTWNGRGADSWEYTIFDESNCVYTDLSINTGERRQLYKDITVSSTLTTFALSIEVYVSADCDATAVFANQEYPFGNNYGATSYNLNSKGTWQKIYAIRDNAYTGNTSNIQTRYRFYFGTNNTAGSKGKIYFRNAQLEVGTVPTRFVNGVRLDTASIIDISGNNRTITASNLTYRQDDTPTFDGTDDYLSLPSILGYTTNVSAFGWFKSAGTPSGNYHIILGGQELEISIYITGYLRTGVYQGSRYVHNHGSGLTDGNWHEVGFTFDGATKVAYIDGVQVGSNSIPAGTLINSVSNRSIGRFGGSNTYYTNGEIDQVKVYNRELTAAEVKQNFESTRSRYGI